MMKILAFSTLYNPQPEAVWAHIRRYLPLVDELLLWDNSPAPLTPERFAALATTDEWGKVCWRGGKGNQGIGVALNDALTYAQQHAYDKLLTMDQDSEWLNFEVFLQQVQAAEGRHPQALFVPHYVEDAGQDLSHLPVEERLNWFYTSGSLFDVRGMQTTGLFRADFFVDGIDTEYTYRLRRQGIPIIRLNGARLLIQLGTPLTKKWMGHSITLPNRPPMRLYGIYRNHLISCKNYLPDTLPELKYYLKKYLWGYTWRILLFEEHRGAKLTACLRGFVSGLFHR